MASIDIGKSQVFFFGTICPTREKMEFSVQRGMVFIIIVITLLSHSVEPRRSSPCHKKCSYVETFQQANCEKRLLDAIPIECNAASYLSLRYNHITAIEPGLFKGFPFLKYLILSNNNISHIAANTFIGAPQLKSIKLLYNNLRIFDRNALNGTENRLRNIYLSRNSLTNIEEGTFQLVPRLEVIDLYRNNLTRLTSGVFQDLHNLERLFLGMNELVDLPGDIFRDLSSLVYLDLSNNSLLFLKIDLFMHLNHLKTIDLSGNKLLNIGNVLSLPNIRLDLRWNRLRQLGHVSLEILNNVDILFLEGNTWYCNCSVEPLRQWYQQLLSDDEDIKVDSPVCSFPRELANHSIDSLNVSLCEGMAAERKETSMVNGTMMKFAVYSYTDNEGPTDLRYQNVTETSETNQADGQMKVVIVVVVAVTFVISFVIVSVVILRVVLLKRRSCNRKTNEDFARNELAISETGDSDVSEKNATVVSKLNEMKEDKEKELTEHTPLIDKTSKNLRKRSPGGKRVPPVDEIIKEKGSNQTFTQEVLPEMDETETSSSMNKEEVAEHSFKTGSQIPKTSKVTDMSMKREKIEEEGVEGSNRKCRKQLHFGMNETDASSSMNKEEVEELSAVISKTGSQLPEMSLTGMDMSSERETNQEEGSNPKCFEKVHFETNDTDASSSENEKEVDELSPLISKTGLQLLKRSLIGTDMTPEREKIEEEGSNQHCTQEVVPLYTPSNNNTGQQLRKRVTPGSKCASPEEK